MAEPYELIGLHGLAIPGPSGLGTQFHLQSAVHYCPMCRHGKRALNYPRNYPCSTASICPTMRTDAVYPFVGSRSPPGWSSPAGGWRVRWYYCGGIVLANITTTLTLLYPTVRSRSSNSNLALFRLVQAGWVGGVGKATRFLRRTWHVVCMGGGRVVSSFDAPFHNTHTTPYHHRFFYPFSPHAAEAHHDDVARGGCWRWRWLAGGARVGVSVVGGGARDGGVHKIGLRSRVSA
jgi:hypothetical protein